MLVGCGVSKKATKSATPVEETPAWHTCVIQGAKVTVTTKSEQVSANVIMQTVRDSMIVISVMPMLGIEMVRLEATPTELIAIDKVHGRYATASFEAVNHRLTPKMSWAILQQICAAELPTGPENAHLQYLYGEDAPIDIQITYTPRKLDVPVKANRLRLDKYMKIELERWL